MHYTNPYSIALQEEQASRVGQVAIQAEVEQLKETLEMRLAEEARLLNVSLHPFLSQVRHYFPTQSELATIACTCTRSYKLMHLTKRPASIVAYGRVAGDLSNTPGCYKIVLDEIIEGSVDLLPKEGSE